MTTVDTATSTDAQYQAMVMDLFDKDPERVESTYRTLYDGLSTWEAPTARERVEGALQLDVSDGDGSLAFQEDFDAIR